MPDAATKTSSATFHRHAVAATAFIQAIAAVRRHWKSNLPGARQDTDTEYLHQLRVALRRLRAIIRLCRPWLKAAWRCRTLGLARRLSRALGAVRDYDVLLASLPAAQAATDVDHGSGNVWHDVEIATHTLRNQAMQGAQQLLRGAACRRFARQLARKTLERSLRKSAATALMRRWARRALRKDFQVLFPFPCPLADLTDPQRHALRIRVKRLRYASELLSPDLKKKRRADFIGALVELQTALGEANDAIVALRLADSLPFDTRTREQFEHWMKERLGQAIARAQATRATLHPPPLR